MTLCSAAELIGALFICTGMTALGWSMRLNCMRVVLMMMSIRMLLNPPEVEPLLPPTNIRNIRSIQVGRNHC